jgi:hypothetical protein
MYGVHTNKKLKICIYCDISLSSNPLQKIQQHQHTYICKKKNVCKIHYPLPPIHDIKIFFFFEINEKIIHFQNNNYIHLHSIK